MESSLLEFRIKVKQPGCEADRFYSQNGTLRDHKIIPSGSLLIEYISNIQPIINRGIKRGLNI
ncbi:MAG: hypothetical protein CL661_11850 [Bacteroidetes bacterium]|jgi:hypothetical protein|nr:hypothetical protein [Bacteroidota bacterium]|tara:strand:- start:1475 stop:1663 length:189 start_codon:yes stop_codon:yes gene_type:complete